MSATGEFVCGQECRAPYPFCRDTYEALPDDPEGAPTTEQTWRPGVDYDIVDNFGTVGGAADAMGEVVFTVIAVFKPGSYPKRVFYTRHWVTPDGKRFGKNKLRITTVQHFRTLIKGYRHDDYEMADTPSTNGTTSQSGADE